MTPALSRIYLTWLTLLSHYQKHKIQGIFLLIGLSLGVAILLGTLLVSSAARQSFNQAQQAIGNKVIANIIPTNGQKSFSQDVYTKLRLAGHTKLVPIVEGQVQLSTGQYISIKGMDIFANIQSVGGPEYQATHQQQAPQTTFTAFAFSFAPHLTLVSQANASLMNLQNGDILKLKNQQALPAIQVIKDDFGVGYSLTLDIKLAQQILQRENQLTSIALIEMPKDKAKLQQALTALGYNNISIQYANKDFHNQALGNAFFLNITAVSFLAFLVGCFIAFNAVRFSVIQRTSLVQQLRLLGTTVKEIRGALIIEFILWSLLASIIGGLLGLLLAKLLLPSVGITLVQMFSSNNPLALNNDFAYLFSAWLMSLSIAFIATFLATAGPFWQLSKQKPLEKTQDENKKKSQTSNKQFVAGFVLVIGGGLLTQLPHSQVLGFVIAACWFIGIALWVPSVIAIAYGILSRQPKLINYPKLHWMINDGRLNYYRLAIAMMAFTVAISAGIAITTLVTSFRVALEDHLELVLAEDIYLMPPNQQVSSIHQYLQQHSDVKLAYRFLHTPVRSQNPASSQPQQVTALRTMSNHDIRHQSLDFETAVSDVWQKLHQRQGVIINQTLAFKQQLSLNQTIVISEGEQQLTTKVLGIYYNYGAPTGAIAIDKNWFVELFPAVDNPEIGIFLQSKKQAETLLEQLKQQFKISDHHYIKPQQIRKIALATFDQTFKVTQVLTIFTLLIAAVGIYCACYAAQLDNQKQLSLLKILGINHQQLSLLSSLQLLFNALIAAIIALPLGILIAKVQVEIILQYSFGWHFPLVIDIEQLFAIIAIAIIIALSAGFVPLYQLSKKPAIGSFKEAL